jgi:hypothetical protein
VELNKKQAQFWTVILVMCIITATVITIIDFGIKTAILEQSNALKRVIDGQRTAKNGVGNYAPVDSPLPGDILGNNAAGMEAGSSDNGSKNPNPKARQRRSEPSAED